MLHHYHHPLCRLSQPPGQQRIWTWNWDWHWDWKWEDVVQCVDRLRLLGRSGGYAGVMPLLEAEETGMHMAAAAEREALLVVVSMYNVSSMYPWTMMHPP